MGRVLVHAHAAAVQGVAVALAVSAFVVSGDRSVGGVPVGRGTIAQATARFGTPSLVKSTGGGITCRVSWARLGLSASFLDFQNHACRDGTLVIATLTSRASWRTALGLRVGDGLDRLRRLYPKAKLHTGEQAGYWLVARRACAEVGGSAYAGLLARVRADRVSALVVTAGVCE